MSLRRLFPVAGMSANQSDCRILKCHVCLGVYEVFTLFEELGETHSLISCGCLLLFTNMYLKLEVMG